MPIAGAMYTRALSVVVAATAGLGLAAASAQADTYYGCKQNQLCFYSKTNFDGYHPGDTDAKPDRVLSRCGTFNTVSRKTGSFMNNQKRGRTTTFWSGKNGTGKIVRRDKNVRFFIEVPRFDFSEVKSVTVC